MPDINNSIDFEQKLENLISFLESNNRKEVEKELSDLHYGDIANLIEAIPHKYRKNLWKVIDVDTEGEVLNELTEDVREQLIKEMDTEEIVSATESLETDDLADIIPNLPDTALHHLLLSMDKKHREHLKKVLSYPEESAGGLMNTDIITVRDDVTVNTVLRYLRLLKKMPADTDQIFVVDRNYKFIGSIYISSILTEEPQNDIKPLINSDSINPISADTPANEVANLFTNRDLISAPVVDKNNLLVGRITIDDVVDVIRDQAERSVMSMAGLDEEDDIFEPVIQSIKSRAIWLGVNLITAFIAVFFINIFSQTLEKMIALAILMPIVASMGGIAGSQTLILVTRGIALGRLNKSNLKWLFNKEIAIGALNGVIWAIVISFATYIWFYDLTLSYIIAAAIVVNLIIAALSGALLPLFLTRLKIDPALAGGVILTTVTDIIGFVAFLGLASLII